MADIEIVVHTTSQEIIKPSSPTPHHLRSFKLCLLDQLFPTFYVPTIFFYPSTSSCNSAEQNIASLKDSLSKTLTRFYPFAGRINDSTTIDCNDEGVLFEEAKVSCDMCDFLKLYRDESLNKLLPCQSACMEPLEKAVQLVIKANIFRCGSIGLGICFLHKLIDGSSFSAFIKAWTEIASRNCVQEAHVHGVAASLFPPSKNLSTIFQFVAALAPTAEGKTSVKSFVFDGNAIASLKEKARSASVPSPTRVQVISGLVWKCLTGGSSEPSAFIAVINLRTRLNPPLPVHSLGNVIWRSVAYNDMTNQNDKDLSYFVDLLNKSIKEVINSEYVQNLQGEEALKQIYKLQEHERETYNKSRITYGFSSLCRMGFYETDFGWGKPLWVAMGPMLQQSLRNSILLMDTRSGDGIEAWMILDENEMMALENDPEFQAYAKLNCGMQH